MPYLVDGHNLIPHVPGITLGDAEDEQTLIRLLQDFARQGQTRIEVFFDQAPPAKAGSRTFGRVTAHFVRQGITADQAIISRLQRMEKEAKIGPWSHQTGKSWLKSGACGGKPSQPGIFPASCPG